MKRLGFLLLLVLALGACADAGPTEADPEVSPAMARVDDGGPNFSPWSPAAVVGPPISYPDAWEGCPFISKDGLDLFFRRWMGASGGRWDIFVAHRETVEDPWGEPVNLGPNINTAGNELCSFVTIDGHWLYFVSSRTDVGSFGEFDLFVSRRKDKDDPTGWETPKNLGPQVNSEYTEHGPAIFEGDGKDGAVFYFSSTRSGNLDVYASEMLGKESFGPASPVAELNSDADDAHAFIRRRDGLEVILFSNRTDPAAQGAWDLYVSTRPTTRDSWSTPVNLGPNINSAGSDVRPSISWDGTTLYFWTNRGGTMDVYQATREKLTGKR